MNCWCRVTLSRWLFSGRGDGGRHVPVTKSPQAVALASPPCSTAQVVTASTPPSTAPNSWHIFSRLYCPLLLAETALKALSRASLDALLFTATTSSRMAGSCGGSPVSVLMGIAEIWQTLKKNRIASDAIVAGWKRSIVALRAIEKVLEVHRLMRWVRRPTGNPERQV